MSQKPQDRSKELSKILNSRQFIVDESGRCQSGSQATGKSSKIQSKKDQGGPRVEGSTKIVDSEQMMSKFVRRIFNIFIIAAFFG